MLAMCGLVGCAGNDEPPLVEVTNRGEVCLLGHEPAGSLRRTFVGGQPIEVAVGGFECLSSSCTLEQAASCETRLEGNTVWISTHASWREDRTGVCTSDCGGAPRASCMTPPLPEGTYTFRIDDRTVPLVIPSMTPSRPCIGPP